MNLNSQAYKQAVLVFTTWGQVEFTVTAGDVAEMGDAAAGSLPLRDFSRYWCKVVFLYLPLLVGVVFANPKDMQLANSSQLALRFKDSR